LPFSPAAPCPLGVRCPGGFLSGEGYSLVKRCSLVNWLVRGWTGSYLVIACRKTACRNA